VIGCDDAQSWRQTVPYTLCPRKKRPPEHIQKSSKLASFAQLQFSSMNICLVSMNLPVLLKISHIIIEKLTFSKWSSNVYRFQKRVTSTTSLSDSWMSGPDFTMRSSVLQLLSGQLICVHV